MTFSDAAAIPSLPLHLTAPLWAELFHLTHAHERATTIAMEDGKSIGIIGMGDMGKMYARRLSNAGWK